MKVKTVFLGIAFGVALVMSISCASANPAVSNRNEIAAVVEGNNAFAFDLYGVIAHDKGNLFLSPFSISSALAMTYSGARGDTASQMAKALHFDQAADGLNSGFSELMKMFNASGKSYQLSVANALWGQTGTMFYPAFVDITKKCYDAGFAEVDYACNTEGARRTINGWVEAKTNNKIVDLIKEGVLNSLTRLVLTNAIYFKGRWESQFKPEATKDAHFYVSPEENPNVPIMYQLGEFKYAETTDIQILELPYVGGEVVMDILLPKPHANLAAVESSLQPAQFQSWLERLSKEKVAVYLPRFKMERDLSLGGALQDLGMKDAFDENKADFSGMSTTFLYITHVIHKAFVEVNEEGTEAAAATAVVMGTKSAPPKEPPVFRADHPFFFVIRDSRTGSVLFMGRMTDPRK